MIAATRTRLPREERREHLLDAAADLVVSKGVDGVTMEAIAIEAGVSKGLGYAYFENRNDVLLALLEREMVEHERRVGEAMAAVDSFEAKIRAAVRAWFDTVAARGVLLGRLLEATPLQGDLKAWRADRYRNYEALYARMAEREFGVSRRDGEIAASVLIAGLSGLLDRWIARRDRRRDLEDTFVRLAIGGLRALAPDRERS